MKKIIILLIVIIIGLGVKAQSPKYELSLSAGGGLSTLMYKPAFGTHTNGLGANFGLGYIYFLNENIGISTGVDFAFSHSQFKADPFSHVIKGIRDPFSGLHFDLHSSIGNYIEKQSATYMNIPIMIQYQQTVLNTHQFYAGGGVKIGIPLKGNFQTKGTDFSNTAYVTELDNWTDEPEFMGLGDFTNRKTSRTLYYKTAFLLALEAGMKWTLSENMFLYTGLYIDYGLNNITKGKNENEFIAYNPEKGDQFYNHSVLNSTYNDKTSLLSLGLKVRFSIGNGQLGSEEDKLARKAEKAARRQANIAEKDHKKAEAAKAAEEKASVQVKQDSVKIEKRSRQEAEKKRAEQEYKGVKDVISLSVMDFDVNSTQLTTEMEAVLDEKVAYLKTNQKMQIICEGHTCNLGSDEVNEKIGRERAKAVKDYLVKKGIESNRIQVVSKGKTSPIVPNDNDENRRKNRRVVFITVEK